MAKPEIPYERVSEAGFQLHARGEKITNRSTRAISGGSPTTVSKHLKRLQAEHAELFTVPHAGGPELSGGVLRVLADELRRQVDEVSATLAGELAAATETIDDLTRENGELKTESSQLESERDERSAENERLQGQVQQQAAELERLEQQFLTEQKAAEGARVDLAEARLRATSQKELADSLRNERESLRQTIDTERAGRLEAERSLASTQAALEQVRKYLDQMIRLHDEIETDRNALRNTLDTERAERATLASRLAASEAEAKAAVTRADDLQRREQDLQSQLKEVRDELRQARAPSSLKPEPPPPTRGRK